MSSFFISDETPPGGAGSGDLAVLSVGGEIDFEASPRLRAGIDEHIKAGRRRIVLDLGAATFIDSTAIGVLVTAVVRLHESGGGSLGVVCTHENVLQIFRITSLDVMVTLYDSRDEALSALALAG
jgi:anti-sigma B factor antagonist